MHLQNGCRNYECNERRNYNLFDNAESSNHLTIPEHDCRNVADRRECTTGISCDDNAYGIPDAVVLVLNKLTQNHNHHNGCCKIVENGRQDSCHERNLPKQRALCL